MKQRKPVRNPFKHLRLYFVYRKNIKYAESGELNQHAIEEYLDIRRRSNNRDSGPQWFRDHIANIIKKSRKYEVNEKYWEAKRMFERWQELYKRPYFPALGEWMTVIADEYPSRGKLFNEYWICSRTPPRESRTFRIQKIYGDGDDREFSTDWGYDESFSIEQCRYATREEIEAEAERRTFVRLSKHVNPLPIADET